jgi:release factor glutamine methyltransferase
MIPAAPGTTPGDADTADRLTIAGARNLLAMEFRAANLDTPELDARILVGHALSLDHAGVAADGARVLSPDQRTAIVATAARRLAREPVARIVGSKEFWSLNLRIDAATLVPRPETETVVEAALAAIDADGMRGQNLRIADLGTGSGALLLALSTELSAAFGIGTDISVNALRVARDNARELSLTRTAFIACDMGAALAGVFDLIVSNPPYIASAAIAGLAPDVRDFDPPQSLDGGPDGLDYYRAIAATVPDLLRPGGSVVVELGVGQASAVMELFRSAGLAPAPPRNDLSGVPRALLARRASKRP